LTKSVFFIFEVLKGLQTVCTKKQKKKLSFSLHNATCTLITRHVMRYEKQQNKIFVLRDYMVEYTRYSV